MPQSRLCWVHALCDVSGNAHCACAALHCDARSGVCEKYPIRLGVSMASSKEHALFRVQFWKMRNGLRWKKCEVPGYSRQIIED